jgi:glucosamine-6-phosphate isomerase
MKLEVFSDNEEMSAAAADQMLQQIKQNPHSVLCLATGETPKRTYQILVNRILSEHINVSGLRVLALDEWWGIPPENPGSCHFFLHEYVFNPLRLSPAQRHVFNALARDEQSECEAMDKFIREAGGIDLMVVGIGVNGHVGFNEPGVDEQLYAHVIELDSTTQIIGQKYFDQQLELKKGITLGLAHFFESRKVLMLANGQKKASIIARALKDEISNQVPATFMRKHTNATMLLDREATLLL